MRGQGPTSTARQNVQFIESIARMNSCNSNTYIVKSVVIFRVWEFWVQEGLYTKWGVLETMIMSSSDTFSGYKKKKDRMSF